MLGNLGSGFTAFIFLMSAIIVVHRSIHRGRIALPYDTPAAEPGEIGEKNEVL